MADVVSHLVSHQVLHAEVMKVLSTEPLTLYRPRHRRPTLREPRRKLVKVAAAVLSLTAEIGRGPSHQGR